MTRAPAHWIYPTPWYIHPFDHRASFIRGLFGWRAPLSDDQRGRIAAAKQVIFDGFRAAAGYVPCLPVGKIPPPHHDARGCTV